MSMQYVRDRYGVPAKRGRKVKYVKHGWRIFGVITSSRHGYVRVRILASIRACKDTPNLTGKVRPFHPTELQYLMEEDEIHIGSQEWWVS